MPFLTVHGCPVRYDRTGNGPTVVLLHGGGLDSAQLSWAPMTPHLVPLAEVITSDLPGSGGGPLGATPATVARNAGWLRVPQEQGPGAKTKADFGEVWVVFTPFRTVRGVLRQTDELSAAMS